ncbi:MAG: class I SAM-dependent methyltransferase [Paracoccaceae bacterium]
MSDPVAEQYEAYPYPERDPEDEKRRLVVGSPSDPVEIDHFLHGGKRNWSLPFRALVAGGGTGDGLIQLAVKLDAVNCPAEIVYLDQSKAARKVAQARARVRGLKNIAFHTADLLEAPAHGSFDYIDCTGVLHHLADPQAGLDALAEALRPGGGMGMMVYAPYGRTGVYDMQAVFSALLADRRPQERLKLARELAAALPEGNRFRNNRGLVDHRLSDAGFYDLLLHGRDRPFAVAELLFLLESAGLEPVSFVEQGKYELARLLPHSQPLREAAASLDPATAMGLAEKLRGNIKTHVLYAGKAGACARRMAGASDPEAVPRLKGVEAGKLAAHIARRGELGLTVDGAKLRLAVAGSAAQALALADGRLALGAMAKRLGMDWFGFSALWTPVHRELAAFGIRRYSRTFA